MLDTYFQFNTHNQKLSESIAEYIPILCKAAEQATTGHFSETGENSADSKYQLFVVQNLSGNPIITTLLVEGQQLTMEIDTGAAVSLVSEETIKTSHLKDFPLFLTDVTLHMNTGGCLSTWETHGQS